MREQAACGKFPDVFCMCKQAHLTHYNEVIFKILSRVDVGKRFKQEPFSGGLGLFLFTELI